MGQWAGRRGASALQQPTFVGPPAARVAARFPRGLAACLAHVYKRASKLAVAQHATCSPRVQSVTQGGQTVTICSGLDDVGVRSSN